MKKSKIITKFYDSCNTKDVPGLPLETKKEFLANVCKSIEQQKAWLIKYTANSAGICKILDITTPTLIKRRNQGMIPFIKMGRVYYYLKPEGASHDH